MFADIRLYSVSVDYMIDVRFPAGEVLATDRATRGQTALRWGVPV